MHTLPDNATLKQLQEHVADWENARNFAAETAMQKCLRLGEEVGELFKAVRQRSGMKVDSTSPPTELGDELADVLIFVVAIANRFQIDLEVAFRAKEAKNNSRMWK